MSAVTFFMSWLALMRATLPCSVQDTGKGPK